jgi:cytidylate kinase
MVSVAIDGPAGAGKSTLARRLAAELGYIYVDTGAMYRAIGLYALRAGKDPKDNAAVDALLPQIELQLASIAGEQHIYLKDEDVSTAIRTEAAGMAASAVGANPAVRAFLLELQRSMAKKQDVLMDGRDIGTVVLPDATVKIFLTASPPLEGVSGQGHRHPLRGSAGRCEAAGLSGHPPRRRPAEAGGGRRAAGHLRAGF